VRALRALVVWGFVAAGAETAAAEVYRLAAPDGTTHYTNAPTDPRYQRDGLSPRPGVTWMRVPLTPPPYAEEVSAAAGRYGIPAPLIHAVIRVESGYNPRAVSRRGARGLMQLMPETAALLGVRDAFNPHQNIDGGSRHLRGLMERFGNDLPLVLAAYNAGEQAVITYRGVPPYQETQAYVNRVIGLYTGNVQGMPRTTFRTFDRDGTLVYTNMPQSRRRPY
jgi:soluble lytic murein transglycosylase-like protein